MSEQPLISPSSLLRTALHHYRAHALYLIRLFSIPFALSIIPLAFSVGEYNPTLSFLGGVVGFVGALSSLAVGISLIAAIHARAYGEGIITTFRRGYPLFTPFLIVMGISIFISLGSYTLLIVPGIILSIFLSQTVFELIISGKRGFATFLASWQLVHGRFWKVFGYLAILWAVTIFIVGIAMLILSLLGLGPTPSLGLREFVDFARAAVPVRALPAAFVLVALKFFVLTPFSIFFLFELHRSLRASSEGLPQLTEESLKKRRTLLVVCGVIGVISLLSFIIFSRVLFNYAVQAQELFGGPNRDFVQTLITLRDLAPEQIQSIFTR